MGAKDDKAIKRTEYAAVRGNVPAGERALYEQKIRSYVAQLSGYRFSDLLLFYAPIRSEVDVFPLALDALKKGRRVAFPRCEEEPGIMTFRFVKSADELETGAFRVREPRAGAERVSSEELKSGGAFLLVPALAFDRNGYRLGYGKGYYDRFLSQFCGFSLGVTFGELFKDELPHGRFDRRVDAVVTERGVKLCRA